MRERAVHFGETAELSGIVTEPPFDGTAGEAPDGASGMPGVILLDAGILHRVGPSRMNVRFARALSRRGFTCLRFDFSGIGESEPRSDRLPFEESSVEEIGDAMDHLQDTRGCDSFILVGLCSGADAAYQGALADERVVGMVPIDGHAYRDFRYYVHRYLPRLFRLESWRNLLTGQSYVGEWIRNFVGSDGDGTRERGGDDGGAADAAAGDPAGQVFQRPVPPKSEVEEALRSLVNREVEMLHLFSGGMSDVYNHTSQFRNMFRDVDFDDRVEVHYFPAASHTFTDLDQLSALVTLVEEWCSRHWSAARTSTVERRGDRAA